MIDLLFYVGADILSVSSQRAARPLPHVEKLPLEVVVML